MVSIKGFLRIRSANAGNEGRLEPDPSAPDTLAGCGRNSRRDGSGAPMRSRLCGVLGGCGRVGRACRGIESCRWEVCQREGDVRFSPERWGPVGAVCALVPIRLSRRIEGSLPSLVASPYTSKAALVVQAGLLTFGAEETSVPQFAQYSRALHGGLESFEKTLGVLSIAKVYECQEPLLITVHSPDAKAAGYPPATLDGQSPPTGPTRSQVSAH